MRECWKEKEVGGWRDLYEKERTKFYIRYGIRMEGNEEWDPERGEKELVERERTGRREEEDRR